MKQTLYSAFTGALLLMAYCISWADPPAESGILVRFQMGGEDYEAPGVYFYYPPTNQTYVLGINVAEICRGNGWASVADWQVIVIEDPERAIEARLLLQESAHWYAGIYEGDIIEGDSPCDWTGVLTPTYEGQVKWRYTDNDLAWADQCFVDPFTPPPNAGSWGFGWNGKVTSLLGTTHTFMGKAQWTWRTCADIDASPVSANIRLQGVL